MARKSNAVLREEARNEVRAEIRAEIGAILPDLLKEIMKHQASLSAAPVAAVEGAADTSAVPLSDPAPAAAPSAGTVDWARELAGAIVSAADPNHKNRNLDPIIKAKRETAHKEMVSLIVEAHSKHHGFLELALKATDPMEQARLREEAKVWQPVYIAMAKMYLNDTKIDPEWQDPATKRMHATEINWDRIPNQGMKPKNEIAQRIFDLFQRSIGTVEAEGLPQAPWMSSAQPWVFAKDGIVRGRAPTEVPEFQMPMGGAPNSQLFQDPRVASSMPNAPKMVRILGKTAPAVEVK